ncbi:MAG: epoxyqueuosine reductase [Chloroflexi bacterium]|nr:epoxyqueuosine reductase [Chloroflexota bacterium]
MARVADLETPRRIVEDIENFVSGHRENRLLEIDDDVIFQSPLVAFASGDDPLFSQYKEIIGDFHFTPREALSAAFPEAVVDSISVISWVLPIEGRTRRSNRVRELSPSLRWCHTRHWGEKFNTALRDHMVSFLKEEGFLAVAPFTAPFFKRLSMPNGPTSNWSERHAAYVAGLGTFGLSDGFITPRGIAHRCGSVVTNLPLPPTPRAYASHVANCPFLVNRSCGECIDRCPAGAITAKGHDKNKCQDYIRGELAPLKQRYNVEISGCGLCQTRVPCEAGIPTQLLARNHPPA